MEGHACHPILAQYILMNRISQLIVGYLPFQCTASWTGSYCQTPICTTACVNGNCSAPNTCTCDYSLWNGTLCDIPVCTPTCLNGGNCSAPGVCDCNVTAWNGSYCQNPICSPACLNGGNCSAPGVCDCDVTSWNGSYCQTPVCNSGCLNGGNCTSPNNCTCPPEWIGIDCGTGKTFQLEYVRDFLIESLLIFLILANCHLCNGSSYNSSCYNCATTNNQCTITCDCADSITGTNITSSITLLTGSGNGCMLDNYQGYLNCSSFCA